ncbi:hypothetical protein LCGC14_2704100 [marine sediment metagenome]|uniref:Uncharacterized protein n=1 Tax=marine sediment metagenome TaxID=412755 RepID=A0A0F9C6P6_9ZZZZ
MDLSRKDFHKALKDDLKQKEEIIKVITRSISEVIRLQTIHLMNVQLAVADQILTEEKMKKIFPFPWDSEEKEQTVKTMKTLAKSIAASAKVVRTTTGLRPRKKK